MKNNKIIYIFLLITASVFSSCNDEFLDRYPTTSITEGNFWNSEQDLITYNNKLYSRYFENKGFSSPGWGTRGGMLTLDNSSDNSFADSPDEVRLGINTSNNPGRTNWSWDLIRNINVFLENYEKTKIDVSIQNRYAAEARFIRALDYYDKVKMYGDLPLIDRVLSENDELLYSKQKSRNEILEFIMDDLNFAVEWLPESAARNRFDKNVARAYVARITLHEGTFRKYHGLGDEAKYLQNAADAANSVMSSGLYTINTSGSYNSLFESIDLSGNKEIVFYKDYDTEMALTHYNASVITDNSGSPISGAKSLINDYLCTDGLPITESILYLGDSTITTEFANRDQRLSNTFGLPNTYFLEDKIYLNSSPVPIGLTACPSGYQVVKFYNEEQDKVAGGKSYMDAPLLRYAEVLLIYAEAKAELGGITQSDIDNTINLLRAKAGVANMLLNKATVISEIRRERRVELAFEGFRYDDLMRWKQGALLAQPVLGLKFNPDDIADFAEFTIGENIFLDANGYIKSNNTYSFDESKNYYFPVPVNELSLNPNLIQTPGW